MKTNMMLPPAKSKAIQAAFWGALLLTVLLTIPARAADTITNAADVLALPLEVALQNVPVHVKGVVTTAETNWLGRFFMEDASGGVFVDNRTPLVAPEVGDVVEVWGMSHPGGYAPDITKPRFKIEGKAPLPAAKPAPIERIMSGVEDSQRVEISGIVRSAQIGGNRIEIEMASGGYRLHAYSPIPPKLDPQSLVGAKLLLRGTIAAAFNRDLRHFVTVTLFVSQLDDFVIQEPAPTGLFDEPLTPLNGIAQFRQDSSPGNQVHVRGVVTYQRQGEDIFIGDDKYGLQIKTRTPITVQAGDVVEAFGFPAVENYLPVLEDAVIRKMTNARVALQPRVATVDDLQKGHHHADLVTLNGRLVDRLVHHTEYGLGRTTEPPEILTTLVLQTTNLVFTAEKVTTEDNDMLTSIPIGSLVRVTGICMLESDSDGKTTSVRILLPTSHDVAILKEPSWFTPARLLISMLILLAVLLLVASWSVMVSQKNRTLKSLVREKESAQHELQEAHDQLEERVAERSAQLKVEMTARKESELRFRAVLTERTRLAQELHDTLEQTMTGIALQLDLVANLSEKNPPNASHHLKLARSLMRQGQVDLRHSVWGLRSRATEKFNLASALITNGRQITGDAGIKLDVQTEGDPDVLSEVAEENLLRIGQEALTNVVKHAGASEVRIHLNFQADKVVMEISDNGRGFDPGACAGPGDGHFGLLGIRERAERLNGRMEVVSVLGKGTRVYVEVPVNQTKSELQIENHE